MVAIQAQLLLVAFQLESERPALAALVDSDGRAPRKSVRPNEKTPAGALLDEVWRELGIPVKERGAPSAAGIWEELRPAPPALAGANWDDGGITLVFTSGVPSPLAETAIDISTETPYRWAILNESMGRRVKSRPPVERRGTEAVALDFWRQALEETDVALDLLPAYFNLLQLRSMYDAVWGYDQDPSGFRRWAVDRPGAFQHLLAEVPDEALDGEFYRSLARLLPPESAAEAAALTQQPLRSSDLKGLGPAIAVASALSVNRLFSRPGPEPTWFARSSAWRRGPSWIQNLYPPRPAWTRWEVDTSPG